MGYAQGYKPIIKLAPLPTSNPSEVIEELLPLFSYIDAVSKVKTEYIYEKGYDKIIEKFKNNEIDLAILGPLPYLKLRQSTQNSQAIIIFRNSKNEGYYRCVLAKYGGDKINLDAPLKIALTQPLSTCGYFMTEQLLKNHYNRDLQNQKYDYKMTHYGAIISVLDSDFHLAGIKESVAEDFSSLGMEILAKSELVPEFTLVANTQTLSKKQIEEITNLILSIPQSTYKKWQGLISNGFIDVDTLVYEKLLVDFNNIPNKGNMQ
jgi:phosphonate transport system substrate-binding protein